MPHRILMAITAALLVLLSLLSCRPQAALYTETFQEVFRDDSSTFRGINLGAPLSAVKQQESPEEPTHTDELGLSYTLTLSEGYTILIDYFSDEVDNLQPTVQLTAIVVNILIGDEVETANLYNEIRNHFNRQYGVSSGVFGNLIWETSTQQTASMEVRLIMHEHKTGIRLNFIDRLSSFQAP